jgi:hypothetical protein
MVVSLVEVAEGAGHDVGAGSRVHLVGGDDEHGMLLSGL